MRGPEVRHRVDERPQRLRVAHAQAPLVLPELVWLEEGRGGCGWGARRERAARQGDVAHVRVGRVRSRPYVGLGPELELEKLVDQLQLPLEEGDGLAFVGDDEEEQVVAAREDEERAVVAVHRREPFVERRLPKRNSAG